MNIVDKATLFDKTFFSIRKNQNLFINDPEIESNKTKTDNGYVYIDSDDIYFLETNVDIPMSFFVKNKILYASIHDDTVSFDTEFLEPSNLDHVERFINENRIKDHQVVYNMLRISLDGNEHLLTYDPMVDSDLTWDGKKKEYHDIKINMDLDYPISFFVRNSIYRGDIEERIVTFPVSYIRYNDIRYIK